MNSLWSITVEDYEEVIRRAKEAGLSPGDSMEAIFIDYMAEKGQQPFARNEFNKEELMNHLTEQKGNILKINTDDKGKQSIELHKKKEK